MTGSHGDSHEILGMRLQPAEWIKLAALILLGGVIPAIVFSVRNEARIDSNMQGVARVSKDVKELTDSIKLLVRHDERIVRIRKEVDDLRDRVRDIEQREVR